MEVTLRDDYNGKYKGYPIFTERMRVNAEAYGDKKIDIPSVNTGYTLFDVDDRMNNKIFKIYKVFEYNAKKYTVSFDLYTDALLEILLNSKIENGVILSPITFIDGGKLVLENGELHNEYLKRQSKVLAKPLKEFKIGYKYKRQKEQYQSYIYYGKINGKHYFIQDNEDYCTWDNGFVEVKTPTFRFEVGCSEHDIDQYIERCRVASIEMMRLMSGYSHWTKKYERILAIINIIKEFRSK